MEALDSNKANEVPNDHFDGVVAAEWSRMSAWSIVFLTVKFFWQIFVTNWSTLVALFIFLSTRENLFFWIIIGGSATAILLAVLGLASFLRFRFTWDEAHLYIRSGIFNRKTVRISYDRIQAVNSSQNILHRVLNLVSIQVDTAGSVAKEAEIIAVNRSFADELSKQVYTYKQQKELDQVDEAINSDPVSGEEELFNLKTSDLLIFGLFANHLQTFGFIFAFGITIIQQLQEVFEESSKVLEENSEQLITFIEQNVYLGIVLIMVFSIVITVAISVGRTILVHYRTQVFQTDKGYRKESGLLTRKKMQLGLSKVQVLHWNTNPLKRAVDMYGLILLNASPKAVNEAYSLGKRFFVPAMGWKDVLNVLERVLGRSIPDIENGINPVHIQYVLRKTLYFGVIPSLVLQTILLIQEWYWGSLITFSWVSFVFLLAYYYRKHFRLQFDQEACYIKTGIFGRTWKAIEWYKVQNVQIQHSPHQRRRGLCTLKLFNAAQHVSIPYLPYAEAVRIRDLVQWRVNTTQKDWM